MVERWSAHSAVFYSILSLMGIILARRIAGAIRGDGIAVIDAVAQGLAEIYAGMVAGARNMIGIAVAVAAAGVIVGAVSSTGLNNAMVGVVEAIAGSNVYILLGLTAVLCIVLGMGLPTTANYLVVASLLGGVLVELGNASGLVLPLIAVHLYVFYYGLLADSTPPVCLAAFAASAISRADPLKTGVQSFLYDIRTAVLPLVFLFNTELLLIGIESIWHGALVVLMSLFAILAFSSLTQGWMLVRVRWYEGVLLAVACFMLFRPGFFMDQVAPPFEPVDFESFVSGEFAPVPERHVRLHVTRETDYGERYRLYALKTPENPAGSAAETFGLRLDREDDGRHAVADLAFNGMAEQAGVEWGDYVTGVDIEQTGLPPKGAGLSPRHGAARPRRPLPASAPPAGRLIHARGCAAETCRDRHEMSCFVMRRRVALLFADLAGAPSVRIQHVVPPSRSVRATGDFPAAGPCFARIAYAPAHAFRAGAHIVRPIARMSARTGRKAHVFPSIPLGFFRAGAKQEAKQPRADAASSCLILLQIF